MKEKNTNKLCKIDGIKAHCPQICNACISCSDSQLMFSLVKGAGENFTTSCDSVKKNKIVCDDSSVFYTCRATCGSCTSMLSLIPSTHPSSIPSTKPSSTLSTVPSALSSSVPSETPSMLCADNKLSFRIRYKSGHFEETCAWVKQNCKVNGIKTHYPQTCNACTPCSDYQSKFSLVNRKIPLVGLRQK